MLNDEPAQLKLEIENEERLYQEELRATQRFDTLKAIRLKINILRQQLHTTKAIHFPEPYPYVIDGTLH